MRIPVRIARSMADKQSDLAKAINSFVKTDDLAKGYEQPGSALEIAFL